MSDYKKFFKRTLNGFYQNCQMIMRKSIFRILIFGDIFGKFAQILEEIL